MAYEKFEGGPVLSEAVVEPVVSAEPDDTDVVVQLRRVILHGQRKISEVCVPRADTGLVMDIDLGRVETAFEVALALTGEPPEVLRRIRHDDMDRVMAEVRKALPSRLRKLI